MSASRRAVRWAAAPAVALGLAGCVPYAAFQGPSARLEPLCAPGPFHAYAAVSFPRGPVQYNGHMLGFDREQFEFTVSLRELPTQPRRFEPAEIQVESTPTIWHVTGGSVDVDPHRHLLSVDLQVDDRPFAGNGRFALAGEPRQCGVGG